MSNTATEKFVTFLTDTSKKISGRTNTTLVSYYFESYNFKLQNKLTLLSKNFEKFFYWEMPEDNFCFLGLGELFSIIENGKNRFISLEKKAKSWHNNIFSNWMEEKSNIPLFVGGSKFLPESNPDIWDNYPDACWTVPRIIIIKKDGKEFILYNFLYNPDSAPEKIIEEFDNRISFVLAENTNNTMDINIQTISSNGNGPKEKKKWIEHVKDALEKIETDQIQKIVLSRYVEYNLDNEPNVFNYIQKFRENYSECYIFIFHSGKSTFFGASPEKLVKLKSDFIETDSLAGSAPRGKDEMEDILIEKEILFNKKNFYEHKTVIEHIEKQFSKLKIKIFYEPLPKVKKLYNIQHLWTPMRAEINPKDNLFNILENLYPTPAVCGIPSSSAIHIIKAMEDYSRGLYSGIIGWFNLEGEGEFTVAIRSALVKGKKLYAFAGSGIVEGSDPQAEYKETELKLKPILSLLENENKG